MIRIVDFKDGALFTRRGGTMRFVHWPGSGSKTVAVHYLELEPEGPHASDARRATR